MRRRGYGHRTKIGSGDVGMGVNYFVDAGSFRVAVINELRV